MSLATVTVLRPTTIPEDHPVTTIQHAIGALTELDGVLSNARIGDTLRTVLGAEEPHGHREHTANLLVGLLGFAEVMLQDLAAERDSTRDEVLQEYRLLNGVGA